MVERLHDYCFPYAIFVSKLIDYFKVDTTNERNETIKAASEIDNSTLMKMDFHKEENTRIFRRNIAHIIELEASNHGDAEEDDAALPMEDETVQLAEASSYERNNSSSHRLNTSAPSMREDVVANDLNALVAYQAP